MLHVENVDDDHAERGDGLSWGGGGGEGSQLLRAHIRFDALWPAVTQDIEGHRNQSQITTAQSIAPCNVARPNSLQEVQLINRARRRSMVGNQSHEQRPDEKPTVREHLPQKGH